MTKSKAAKALLEWNGRFLTAHSDLSKEKIAEVFADTFTVIANGRTYQADYDNYLEFLNGFRATIKSIDYECDSFITHENLVVIPMTAHIVRTNESHDKFTAILILEFNAANKVILWKEVYVQVS